MPNRLVVSVEGKQYTLGPFVHATKGFDAQGKPLPAGQATRLAWEGNIVDIITRPALAGRPSPRWSRSGSSRARWVNRIPLTSRKSR